MEKVWKPGEVIWTAGDEDVRPVRVHRGLVTYVIGQERRQGLGFIGPGGTALPIPGVLGPGKALLGLMALTEAETESTPIIGIAAESVTALVRGAERVLTQDLPQRLAGSLLEMTRLLESDTVETRQETLAIALGVRRETLAVVLSQWNNAEWIRTRYRRVIVKDRDALAAISEGRLP
jgi:hypothetical protein